MTLPIRIKTYDDNGLIHGRFDLDIEDIADIERVIEDIDEILRDEFYEIHEEDRCDDSIVD